MTRATLLYIPGKSNEIMAGYRLPCYSIPTERVYGKGVCGMWDGLDRGTPETNTPKS